ncbi:hypothetical protein [Sphingobacterium sp. LRF_L2]|uniref:hypothetical protein n=1 Tax=Sphingobacterium sp. LRF_L2 TaxID=3369421 RepID=UPI003F6072A5
MKFLGKDNILFEQLTQELSILSSQIIGFNIKTKDYSFTIEVEIKLLYSKGNCLKLVFSKIKEYAFYNNSSNDVYYIEDYKLMQKNNLYYISFDPDANDLADISDDDNDFILCENMEGYIYSSES